MAEPGKGFTGVDGSVKGGWVCGSCGLMWNGPESSVFLHLDSCSKQPESAEERLDRGEMKTGKFKECRECREKTECPTLCDSCAHNRAVIECLTEKRVHPLTDQLDRMSDKIVAQQLRNFLDKTREEEALKSSVKDLKGVPLEEEDEENPEKPKVDPMFLETPEGGSRAMYLHISLLKDRIRKAEPRVRELEANEKALVWQVTQCENSMKRLEVEGHHRWQYVEAPDLP